MLRDAVDRSRAAVGGSASSSSASTSKNKSKSCPNCVRRRFDPNREYAYCEHCFRDYFFSVPLVRRGDPKAPAAVAGAGPARAAEVDGATDKRTTGTRGMDYEHVHVHDGVVVVEDRADSDAAGSAGAGDDLAGEHLHAHERVDHRVRPPDDVVESESRGTKTDFCEEISSSAVLSLADFRISSADMNLGGGGSSSRDKEQKAARGISPSDSTAPEHPGPAGTAAVTAGGAGSSATKSTSTADPRPGDNTNRDNPAKASPTTTPTPATPPTTPEIDGCRFVHLALDGDTAEFVRTCEQAFDRRCGFDRVALDVLRSFLRSFMSNTDVNGLLGTGKMWLLSTAQMREMMGFDDEDHGGSECRDEGGWRVIGPAENQAAGPGSSGGERGETVLGQVPVARADGRGDDEAGACPASSGCSAPSAVHRGDERSAASDAEAGEGLDSSRRNNWNDNKGNENYSEAEASTTVSSSRSSSSRTRLRPEGEGEPPRSRSPVGRAALPTPPTGAVLDVGAGCGYITQQMRPFFRQVAATEVSTKMAARMRSSKTADLVFLADSLSNADLNAWLSGLLLQKENDDHESCGSNSSREGARAPLLLREHTPAHTLAPHELHEDAAPSHRKNATPPSALPAPDRRQRLRLITCFNVLDRCQQPLTLLREMRKLCVEHGCRLLLSAVFPFEQWIEGHVVGSSNGTTAVAAPKKPKFERIAYRGQAHARSFEEQAAGFARHVLVRTLGFKLVKFARAPYISAGSAQAPLYVLSNGVFLLEPCEQSSRLQHGGD